MVLNRTIEYVKNINKKLSFHIDWENVNKTLNFLVGASWLWSLVRSLNIFKTSKNQFYNCMFSNVKHYLKFNGTTWNVNTTLVNVSARYDVNIHVYCCIIHVGLYQYDVDDFWKRQNMFKFYQTCELNIRELIQQGNWF